MAVRKRPSAGRPAVATSPYVPHSSWSQRDAALRPSMLKPEEFWTRLGL